MGTDESRVNYVVFFNYVFHFLSHFETTSTYLSLLFVAIDIAAVSLKPNLAGANSELHACTYPPHLQLYVRCGVKCRSTQRFENTTKL